MILENAKKIVSNIRYFKTSDIFFKERIIGWPECQMESADFFFPESIEESGWAPFLLNYKAFWWSRFW